jgi:hypothetical protein
MLEKEFQYYLTHKQELLSKHSQKFLVIVGEKVIDSFNTEIEAYSFGVKNFTLGTFLIQHCISGDDNSTQTFHSRVIFA